ncbi:traB domain-containing protein-like isoform X3 [Mercenaria mercenaria]|nr:traB domain-containing protein-like isoform X3 [Mercenaria mercenaria]
MSAETGDKQPETVKESPLSDSGRGSQSVVIINTENLNADVDQDVQIVENNNVDTDDDMNRYVYSDDFESDDEEDIEDSDELAGAYPSVVPGLRQRADNPVVPSTVTTLETPWGSKVYIVGTAHFSKESQDDVTKTIEATQPDVVMVELCNSRLNILQLDEEKLLEEAQNINLEKIQLAIKQSGLGQGIMHLLFLSMSAHLTKQLGMAPGGEFRRAFRDAKKIAGCRLQLGDRPIQVTLRRALSSLSVWQKIRLAWYLLTSNDPISKEDVEKCKQKDLLEEMLKEMTGEFPGLSEVFVKERDSFLAHSLKHAAQPLPHPVVPGAHLPSVVVGVVGMGHVPGIMENWEKLQYNMKDIMT